MRGRRALKSRQFNQVIRSLVSGRASGSSRYDLRLFPIRDASYIRKLIESIRPGGIIVFEHFLSPDPIEAAGMVGVPAENELLKTFSDFHVVRYEEVTEIADWVASGKPAPIVRLLATKR